MIGAAKPKALTPLQTEIVQNSQPVNWKKWALIGGGVLVLGVAAYFIFRKKKVSK